MRLVQFISTAGKQCVGVSSESRVETLRGITSVYELFSFSESNGITLENAATTLLSNEFVNFSELAKEKRLRVPLNHPDPYHTWVTGTGLTHLGSASSRNAMHQKAQAGAELTDSIRMFQMGVENGKMKNDVPGVQPEWFFKGNGLTVVSPGEAIPSPSFALDGGEEPEIAALYIIGKDAIPKRIGYALGNEFSDHKMEKINYLYLAHSKLRACSYGPELLLGDLPSRVSGKSRIWRNSEILWEKDFQTGEENMSHNILNLEYHHFKYDLFRQPGDVHVHFIGTSALSFSDNIQTREGDVFEISADAFQHPLVNSVHTKAPTFTV